MKKIIGNICLCVGENVFIGGNKDTPGKTFKNYDLFIEIVFFLQISNSLN